MGTTKQRWELLNKGGNYLTKMGPTRQRWDLLDKYLRAKGPKRAQRGPRYKNKIRAKGPKGPKGSKHMNFILKIGVQ